MPIRVVSADARLRSCECCEEPFGRLEALRAPIPLGCRHVICIGCLRDDGSSCPICGVIYSKERFQTLFDLVATSPQYTPLPLELEDIERVLQRRCLAVNETTPLSILQDVFGACSRFLDDQPRNKFTELANLARFLSYQIKAQETIEAMAFSIESLAGTVQHLNQRLDREKDDRAHDRALFDQQLEETNARELDLLERIDRLESERGTPDQASTREPYQVSHPQETSPRLEVPFVHVPYSRLDNTSRPLSPLPISSIPEGFGDIHVLHMRFLTPPGGDRWGESTPHGNLYPANNVPAEPSPPRTTSTLGHFPYSTTALLHGTLDYPSQSPMTIVPPTIQSRQIWLPPTPPHVSDGEDYDEYHDFVDDEAVPEFQSSS